MGNGNFNVDTEKVKNTFQGLQVLCEIGRGGQKCVYKGLHPTFGQVALKIVYPNTTRERERINREIAISTSLEGSEFARVYEYGEVEIDSSRVLYILEECLDGNSLRERLNRDGSLSIEETFQIVSSVLMAISRIHALNIVHRDIKPENVFLTNDNRVVLLDFGIARDLSLESLTHDFAVFGPLTPGYASPEQIRNEKRRIGPRTDIFPIGILTYECLAGYNPFTQGVDDPREALERNLNYNPPPLSKAGFAVVISDFVETCIQKHPNRRYGNSEEALRIVDSILEEVS